MILNIQNLTNKFQKMTIFIMLFLSINLLANEKIVLGITGVALKEDISTIIKFKTYLQNKTSIDIQIKFARSYSTIRHLILEKSVDMAYICGATYVDLEPSKKVELLALPTVKQKPQYFSLVISKKSSNYKTIDDFEGKLYAMSDPESNSGSLVARYEIIKRGYKNNHFFKKIIYTYDHGDSIEAVLNGYVQGASVDSIIYREFLRNHPKSSHKLKIVQRFGPFPVTPFVINKNISENIKHALQKTLINMDKDKKGRQILYAMAINSFIKPGNISYKKIADIKLFLSAKK